MSKMNKNAKIITNNATDQVIGRIGGNIPEILVGSCDELEEYFFYMNIKIDKLNYDYISIFVPKNYLRRVNNNCYPKCDVKIINHKQSKESTSTNHTLSHITPLFIGGYWESDENDFVTIKAQPDLIQEEDYYQEQLTVDGFRFFMQIDEWYYPENMLNDGSYIFASGMLYLYENIESGELIAGFWQYS